MSRPRLDDGLLRVDAAAPIARLVLAHGAGAPMDSDFMNALAAALAGQGISTLRFEFPYMAERRRTGGKRPPDREPRLLDAWRDRVRAIAGSENSLPLLIGGKSMGGRMASLVVDELAAELGVAGLCCYGYPFHPPGKVERLRTAHLAGLRTSALILQGTRDPFGTAERIAPLALSPRLRIHWLADGDHDFKPRRASGTSQLDLIAEAARATGDFALSLADSIGAL
ncbi:MAG TPA: alpha/beta family hydrolase [Porticoccaceae bacterium]|nr:alpha/beta family hydrolase [Porticoccaceae bacterium]